ncbi:MAG: hypothetical protein GX096_07855 [Clostridiales bacterium]|nr:hypothetical protein [Clostridiales bacterium]
MKDMAAAGAREKELRSLYRIVSEADIAAHTDAVIGDLLRIEDDKNMLDS